MLVCGVVAFSVLIARLYKVMIVDHEYYQELAVEQQTRETKISAARGTIYDANGNVLAMSATAYTVFISPYEMEYYGEDASLIARGLSAILDTDYDSILEKTQDTKSWYKTVAVKIESDLADEVREFKSENDLNSIHIENDSKRYYPYGSLACHVIGFVGTDNYGLEGIEAVYDDYLKGTDGSVVRLTTSEGVDLLYENYENYNDAVNGGDVSLTLDVTVQNIAEKYLKQAIEDNSAQNGGCAIVMNVNTGAIMAMVSANDYDLNSPWTLGDDTMKELDEITDPQERDASLAEARLKQWRNTAISDTYEPGSVFKIITMAMALDEGVVNENSSFYCGGSMEVQGRGGVPLNCWKTAGHGAQTLKSAAQHSCNVAFVNIGMAVGAERFYDYVDAFGLFKPTGVDLSGEAGSQWWTPEIFCDKDNLSQLAAASFGQTFNVTPLQMITAVSSAVNGGNLMEPYIVSEIRNPDGTLAYSKEPTVVRQVISSDTSAKVCEILESVVGETEGTGKNAYVAGYRIGGKTGTTTKTSKEAATGEKEYMVSFCGIAPADDPEIAVLVVLDNPSRDTGIYVSGGVMAAPVVGGIMSEVLPYLGIDPEYTEEEMKLFDETVPKLTGNDINTAMKKLSELNLTVRVVGEGTKVTDQLPASGAEVAAGSEVIIYTDGKKPSEMTQVPDVCGLTAEQAQDTFAYYGLYMDTSGAPPINSSIIVSQQSVESGEETKYGSVIKVTLVDSSNQGQY